jgi:hypothetical protein
VWNIFSGWSLWYLSLYLYNGIGDLILTVNPITFPAPDMNLMANVKYTELWVKSLQNRAGCRKTATWGSMKPFFKARNYFPTHTRNYQEVQHHLITSATIICGEST